MRRLICAASLALACSVSQSAFGAVGPFARLDISGEPAPIFINAVPSGNGKTFLINGEQGYQRTTSEYSISISGEYNPDPQINYAIAATDFGAPTTFLFTMSTSIVSTPAPNVVQGSISAGLQDAGANGASVTPTLADQDGDTIPEIQVNTVFGGPTTNMGVDVGPSMSIPSGTQTYGPFNAGLQAGPGPGPWSFLQVEVGFQLSCGGDSFTPTGMASINVPEPAIFGLTALGALPMLRRRRA